MRRLTALLLLCAWLLTGCWSRREVNDLGVVMTLGMDLNESGKLKIWLVVAQPGAAGQAKGASGQTGHAQRKVVLVREGRTLTEAMRAAELVAPRRLALHHVQVILLGDRLVESGLDNLLDILMRNPQIRMSANVVILRGQDMDRLLSAEPIMENMQSVAIREMEAQEAGLSIRLKDLFLARATHHIAAILPLIHPREHETTERGTPRVEAELSGAAIFRDGRVAKYLSATQVRGAMWLRGQVRNGVVTVPCEDQPGQFLSARITRGGSRLNTWWDGKRVRFGVTLSGTINVQESQCNLDLAELKNLNRVREQINDALEQRVADLLSLCQEIPADPFQFGELFRVNYPALWPKIHEKWPEYWANVSVTVQAEVLVNHVGTNATPPALAPPASH